MLTGPAQAQTGTRAAAMMLPMMRVNLVMIASLGWCAAARPGL
jgi:hypothetical protein